jgi:hypothetical protein
MKPSQKRQAWVVLGLSAVLMGGLAASGLTSAEAAPRRYARDLDRDCIPNYRDRDRDGDRISNWRDPHPNRRDRYVYIPSRYQSRYSAYSRSGDLDRDCVPNYRDRDRDGDRVPNWRDRAPNSRRYR